MSAKREACYSSESTSIPPLHRGYEATAPARIDRLRMAADAGATTMRTRLSPWRGRQRRRAAGWRHALLRRGEPLQRSLQGATLVERAAGQGDRARSTQPGSRAWLTVHPSHPRSGACRATGFFDRTAGIDPGTGRLLLGLLSRASDPAQAVAYWQSRRRRASLTPCISSANACAAGEGTDQDAREAMRWNLRAAALDHPAAIQEPGVRLPARETRCCRKATYRPANMRLALEHALRHPKAAP